MATERYRNPSGVDVDSRGLFRWIAHRVRHRLPRPPQAPIVGVVPDLAFLRANHTETTLTWIGHATVLLQVGGINILTDPVFSRWASPVPVFGPRRHQPPGVALAELPHIDLVLISHGHYDHLDLRSVRALARQAAGAPHFMVPHGMEGWFARNVPGAVAHGPGANVHALAWNEGRTAPGSAAALTLHFLPVQHWTSRSALTRNDTAWGSWAVRHPDFNFWFSGDLGYSPDPARIGAEHGPFDYAAIAVGAYEPRWFMRTQHVNPDEAVQVMLDVRATAAMGIHWGTFALTDEPLDQPPRDLAAALEARGIAADRFTVYRHGETRRLSRPPRG